MALRLDEVTALAPPGRSGEIPEPLLRSVSLSLEPGTSHLLLGANGAGKTTLIRILAGLRRPASGRVTLDGCAVTSGGDGRGLWPAVAALFEEPDPQFLSDTVEGEVAFGLESLGLPSAEVRRRAAEALEAFGLAGVASRAPHDLSAGEKARALLAAALAGEPRVLVLDQATAHLDPGSRRALEAALVRDALAGARSLVRTHQDAHAPYGGEVLHVLDHGVLREASGLGPAEVLALARTPFPLALRASSLLAVQGRWEGPLAADAAALASRLAAGTRSRRAPDATPGPRGASTAGPRAPLLTLSRAGWTPPTRGAAAVLAELDLEVGEGEVVALLGRSGSGKSTALRLACGLIEPTAGRVALPGAPGRHARPVALAMEHPERQLFGRTAEEDVAALLWVEGMPAAERRRLACLALAEVGLDPGRYSGRTPLSLSEGEKRRVALAGLLVEPPLVVLLDEPTAGLDPEGRRSLATALEALRGRGRAVLLASHDLDFVGAVADRVVLLARDGEEPGGAIATGPAAELLRDEGLLARAGLPAPDFVFLERALRAAGLVDGPPVRDGETLLQSLARSAQPAAMIRE